jgi:hypothetical protein
VLINSAEQEVIFSESPSLKEDRWSKALSIYYNFQMYVSQFPKERTIWFTGIKLFADLDRIQGI